MEVNVPKTHVVVFCRPVHRNDAWAVTYKGQALSVVPSTKYLGMHFSADGRSEVAVDALCAAARRAKAALQRLLLRLKYVPLQFYTRLFCTIVRPVLTYGCQIWGVYYLKLPSPHTFTSAPPRYDFVPTSPL